MIGIGIVAGTVGYGLVVYGAKLFKGDPQSLAYLFGFTTTNSAAKPGGGNDTKAQAAAPADHASQFSHGVR